MDIDDLVDVLHPVIKEKVSAEFISKNMTKNLPIPVPLG